MRKLFVIWVCLILFGCDELEFLVAAPECYTGQTRDCTVGSCPGKGTQTCKDGEWGECVGYQTPSTEVCDGIDNDCNGLVDDVTSYTGIKIYIDTDGDGYGGDEVKTTGICSVPPGFTDTPGDCNDNNPNVNPGMKERCDGIDNDCNYLVDDNVQAEVCYTGPPETQDVGECKSGITRCVDGVEQCYAEILPQEPVCNSNKDYDCDGALDSGQLEVVFLLDISGSMDFFTKTVRDVLFKFSDKYKENINIKAAVVEYADDCYVRMPLLPAVGLSSVYPPYTAGKFATEASYDCLAAILHPEDPLGLQLSEDVPVVIVLITDDECTSYWCNEICVAGWCRSVYSWDGPWSGLRDRKLTQQDLRPILDEHINIILEVITTEAFYEDYKYIGEIYNLYDFYEGNYSGFFELFDGLICP